MMKAFAAAVSRLSAARLWPRGLVLASPAALREANEQLRRQIRERDAAVAALQRETAERRRAQEQLRQSQKMQAVGQLTGGIAHDFNNLLAIVMGNLQLLQERVSGDAEARGIPRRCSLVGATRRRADPPLARLRPQTAAQARAVIDLNASSRA